MAGTRLQSARRQLQRARPLHGDRGSSTRLLSLLPHTRAAQQPLPPGKSSTRRRRRRRQEKPNQLLRGLPGTPAEQRAGMLWCSEGRQARVKESHRRVFQGQQMDWDFSSSSSSKAAQPEPDYGTGGCLPAECSCSAQGARVPPGRELGKCLTGRISSRDVGQTEQPGAFPTTHSAEQQHRDCWAPENLPKTT